jgi:hypothetical protein
MQFSRLLKYLLVGITGAEDPTLEQLSTSVIYPAPFGALVGLVFWAFAIPGPKVSNVDGNSRPRREQ